MQILEQLTVFDPGSVGEGRRIAGRIAEELGFDEKQMGKVSIVVNELLTNQVKYASGGEFVVVGDKEDEYKKLHIYAFDNGPGMENVSLCLQDGYSSGGTVGGGLGAISRLPSVFDIYSRPGKGVAVYCAFHQGDIPSTKPMTWESLNFKYPGEAVSGDAFSHFDSPNYSAAIVADGLGHGDYAHEASQLAVETFHKHLELQPAEILEKVHLALGRTRGAAVAIARINHQTDELIYSGLGNISAQIYLDGKVRPLMSGDGIVGQNARRFHTETYPWSRNALLTMFSDGLSSRLRLDTETYPGFALRNPALLTSILMRDFKRGKDDTTIVVASAQGVRQSTW